VKNNELFRASGIMAVGTILSRITGFIRALLAVAVLGTALLAERFKQQQELIKNGDLFQQVIVSDYMFTKCLLFAKANLPEEEFRLYQKMFDVFYQQLTPPDILIYLHAPVNRLQSNIKKRNRKFEQAIPDEYLFKIQETYTSYIKQHNIRTIFVDASNADFLYNEAHLKVILDALDKDLEEGQHYFNLP